MWGCILCLVNHLFRFPLTSEHDDAPDALEGALPLLRSSAQVIGQAVIIVWGILDRHNWGFLHSY